MAVAQASGYSYDQTPSLGTSICPAGSALRKEARTHTHPQAHIYIYTVSQSMETDSRCPRAVSGTDKSFKTIKTRLEELNKNKFKEFKAGSQWMNKDGVSA